MTSITRNRTVFRAPNRSLFELSRPAASRGELVIAGGFRGYPFSLVALRLQAQEWNLC